MRCRDACRCHFAASRRFYKAIRHSNLIIHTSVPWLKAVDGSLDGSERGRVDLLGGSEIWCVPRAEAKKAAGMRMRLLCERRERARIQTHSTPSHFDHLRDARKSTRYARGSSAEHVEMETWGTTKRVSTGCRPGGDERGRQRM